MNVSVIKENKFVKNKGRVTMISSMPDVMYCGAATCVFNDDNLCNAGAINMRGPDPVCDLYMKSETKIGNNNNTKLVLCKVSDCYFNRNSECSARGVAITLDRDIDNIALCDTFRSV